MIVLLTPVFLLAILSDSQGGGHTVEELHTQRGPDGGAASVPLRHDQTLQQQP